MSSESKTKLQGRVIQAADGKGVSGVEVGIWLKAPGVQDLLGTAKTDKDGAFAVSVDGARLAQLATQNPSSLFFGTSRKDEGLACFERVLSTVLEGRGVVLTLPDVAPAKGSDSDGDGTKGKSKSKSKQRDEAPAKRGAASKAAPPCRDEDDDDEDDDDDDDDHSNPPDPDKDTLVVRGQVRDADGKPLAGAIVRAVDRDLRSEEPLGEAQTCLCGFYRIQYKAEQFKRLEKKRADLVIKVFRDTAEPAVQSPIQFNAAADVIVDLMIGGGVYRGPSEYEALVDEIAPLLDGVAVAELTDDDLSFLSGETERALALLQHLRTATQLALTTALAPEVHYAFLRRDLPAKLDELLRVERAAYERAIVEALEQNLIPSRLKATLPAVLARLEELRAQSALDATPDPFATPPRDVLETAIESADLQQKFMSAYLAHEGSIESFWEQLRSDPEFTPEVVENLQKSLQVGLLTHNHVPMITAVKGALTTGQMPVTGQPVTALMDLARLDESDWRQVIQHEVAGQQIGVPDGTPGGTSEEKIAHYAKVLTDTVEAAFPTQVIAHRTARDQPEGAQDLTRFFSDNPNFEIREHPVQRYLKTSPGALDGIQDKEGTIRRLSRMQRLHRVTGRYEAIRPLLDDGIDSARTISRVAEKQFVERYAARLGGPVVAARIHRRARQTAAATQLLFARYGSAFAGLEPAAIAKIRPNEYVSTLRARGDENAHGSAARAVQLPDWEELFGPVSFCNCNQCQSVLSPGAYLVDIFNMLEAHPLTKGDPPGRPPTLLTVLTDRRPDLVQIELSCNNTNTLLPYIDLVNEVLEDAVVVASTGYELASSRAAASARQRQTHGTAAELAAHPEYLNPQAYEVLGGEVYPWMLPFDLWLEEARSYFGLLGTARERLMEVFQREVLRDDVYVKEPAEIDIVTERLHLTTTERLAITSRDNLAEVWGGGTIDLDELRRVPVLLERSGLTLRELKELLGTAFLGSVTAERPRVVFDPEDPCNLDKAVVHPLNNEILRRLHQLARLRRKLGAAWSLEAIDHGLGLFTLELGLDDSTLTQLAGAERLAAELKLSIKELLDLWAEEPYPKLLAMWARALDTTPAELSTLIALLGVEPWAAWDPPEVLRWIRRARKLLPGPLHLDELAYVYLHRLDAQGRPAPTPNAIREALEAIRGGLARVDAEADLVPEPTREALMRALERITDVTRTAQAVAFLDACPVDSPENRALIALHFPFLGAEVRDRLLLSEAPADDLQRLAYQHSAREIVLENVQQQLRQAIQRQVVEEQLASAIGIDGGVTNLLLGSVLKSSSDAAEPAIVDFLWLLGDGVRASYTGGGNSLERVEPVIDFVWRSSGPGGALPVDSFEGEYAARLWAPSMEPYTFVVSTNGGVRLEVAGEVVVDSLDGTTIREITAPPVTAGGIERPLDLKLQFRANGAEQPFLRLEWQSSSREREVVPTICLFSTPFDLASSLRSYERLFKAGLLVNALALSARELRYLNEHPDDFGGFDLNGLPLESTAGDPASVVQWEQLAALSALRDRLPKGDAGLFDLFELAVSEASDEEISNSLVNLTGWNKSDVVSLFGPEGFDLHAEHFRNADWILRMETALAASAQIDVPIAVLQNWVRGEPNEEIADAMRVTLRGRYKTKEWLEIEKPLRDRLREQQRAALLGYLVPRSDHIPGGAWTNEQGVFYHYLIDVEMSSCQLTSRVKQAISAAQLFVQRCWLNLEEGIQLDPDEARIWQTWMKSYRLWEANRKIFLYPENWLRSELRRDKSPFFEELEQRLLQNEITDERAEAALLEYLRKLDTVAYVQVAGIYYELDEAAPTMHVFGHTHGTPRQYYYRRLVKDLGWTAWEKLELDIEGDHLIPMLYNRRLYLFWPVFEQKAKDTDLPTREEGGKKPDMYAEIKMAWSVREEGRWLPKRVSSAILNSYVNGGKKLSREPKDYVFCSRIDAAGDIVIECYAREVQS